MTHDYQDDTLRDGYDDGAGPDIASEAWGDDCDNCGAPNDDGEGWNGLCGNCADAAEPQPEPMRQQVEAWALLTYDADATMNDDELRDAIQTDLNRLTDADSESRVELQMSGIATIREEATIYSNADGPADMLNTLKAIVRAFPPTLHRNEAQKRALADARSIVAVAP